MSLARTGCSRRSLRCGTRQRASAALLSSRPTQVRAPPPFFPPARADLRLADRDDCVRMALMTSVYQYCRLIIFYAGLRAVLQRGELKDDTVFFAGVRPPSPLLALHPN